MKKLKAWAIKDLFTGKIKYIELTKPKIKSMHPYGDKGYFGKDKRYLGLKQACKLIPCNIIYKV